VVAGWGAKVAQRIGMVGSKVQQRHGTGVQVGGQARKAVAAKKPPTEN